METSRFVGSVPEVYDRYLGPVLFEPFAVDLSRRLPAEARLVLEIAAGTGRVTRQLLAQLATDGRLVATDLNEPMLVEAHQRIGNDPRVSWQTADAQALPFDETRFDAIACQFGLMFMPDPLAALREMRRVLRPGGALLLNTWNAMRTNQAQHLVHELACAAFPHDPPRFLEVPFSLPDPHGLASRVRDAGFSEVRVETVGKVAEAGSAADFAIGLVRGTPLWHQLVERGVDAPAFEADVVARLIRDFGDAPCRSGLSAHVVTAVA